MKWFSGRLVALTCAVALTGAAAMAVPAEKDGTPSQQRSAFGKLGAASEEEAKGLARNWLASTGKGGAEVDRAFAAIWARDRSVLERVADTFALGDAGAALVLAEARGNGLAPTSVPALLKDARKPVFFRANLALAYGRALVERRVYEEGLEALALVQPEDVVDPSAYLFHRAVCEHALMMKDEAGRTLDRLLVDVPDGPERHRQVGERMQEDLKLWEEKDLLWIARKMDNIQRRLELGRGGEKTRRQQREVLAALQKLIDEMQPPPPGDGPRTPRDGPGGPGPRVPGAGDPARESDIGSASGDGSVDARLARLRNIQWGNLPPKERARIMAELTRGLPARDRALLDNYIRSLSRGRARR
jgi:hypothetical protein